MDDKKIEEKEEFEQKKKEMEDVCNKIMKKM